MLTAPSSLSRLPTRLTPFVGRQAELERMRAILQDPSVRLVTVLGAGGVGKTSFALETARIVQDQFQHGVVFVPLAQLGARDEILPALAEALGVQLPPGGDLQQAVLDRLSNHQVLLILDNFEHLLDEAILLRDILAAGTQVKVLVTSREKLNLEVETLYHLNGLELPPEEALQKVEDYDAMQLFLQKARQARPGFFLKADDTPSVVRICQLVDGNPLGILLAAAWMEHFSPAEIADQISSNLDFLTRNSKDAEPRHASMRAVFDSSFGRLSEDEKAVFRKLSVFRGGFDLRAAEAVAGAGLQTLIALTDKSLLSRQPDSGRYSLHELLQQYAGEELDAASEDEKTLEAHAQYYLTFIQRQEATLTSAFQNKALDEIQADFDNIRQACAWAVETRDFTGVRIALPGLYAFCDHRSRFYEAAVLFHQASQGLAPRENEAIHPAWALALLSWYDMRAYYERFASHDEITSMAERCLEQAESIQDRQMTAASLVLLGAIVEDQLDFEQAIRKYQQAMQADPSLDDVYWVNMRIGLCHLSARQYPEAISAFQVCLRRGQETGEQVKTGWSLLNTGDTLLFQFKPAEAKVCLEQARGLFEQVGTQFGVMWANHSLGRADLALGDPEHARAHAEVAAPIARQLHSTIWIGKTEALFKELDSSSSTSRHPATELPPGGFSPRELEVLQLLKSDLTGPEIADRLVISLNTVRFHTKNIYQKLGVNNRLEAIQRAKELGL